MGPIAAICRVKDKLQELPLSTHAHRIERDTAERTIHGEDTVFSATHTSNLPVLPAGDRREYTIRGVSSHREVYLGFTVDCAHEVKPIIHV